MSQREKILATAVGCLVPFVLIFLGLFSFKNRYDLAKSKIATLDKQIQKENELTLQAFTAGDRRQFFYVPSSFPNGKGELTAYQDWLEKLIRDCGLRYRNIAKPKKNTFKFKTDRGVYEIGDKVVLNFDTIGTLDEIMHFIYEFEQIELLHKIRDLTLQPVQDKDASGDVKAAFKVELLVLDDADEFRDFKSAVRKLPKSLEDYENVVIARNIFGPANNAPELKLYRKTFSEGDEIKVRLSGRDADKRDKLTYEIVDAEAIDGAQIESKKSGSRESYSFVAPALPVGEYTATIRVKDNGYPAKFADAELDIVVKEKKAKEKKVEIVDEKPEPPKYKSIVDSQINSITSRNGEFQARIRVRSSGEIYDLAIGDEFEIDEEIWKVRSISMRRLMLESAGKLMEFRLGDFLNEPRNIEEVEIPSEDVQLSSLD